MAGLENDTRRYQSPQRGTRDIVSTTCGQGLGISEDLLFVRNTPRSPPPEKDLGTGRKKGRKEERKKGRVMTVFRHDSDNGVFGRCGADCSVGPLTVTERGTALLLPGGVAAS